MIKMGEGWKNSNFYEGSDYDKADMSKVKFSSEIMEKIHAWLLKKRDMLIFCGTVGIGKTFLAHAICKFWSETVGFPRNQYLLVLERDIYTHLQPNTTPGFSAKYELEKFKNIPFVAIDDFGTAKKSEFRDEVLFDALNGKSVSRLPTLITSNLFINDIKREYSDRIYSRMTDSRNTIIELADDDLRQTART